MVAAEEPLTRGEIVLTALTAGLPGWVVAIVAIFALVHQKKASDAQLAFSQQVDRESNQPYVIVDIRAGQPGTTMLILIIENIGRTVARNVRIQVLPALSSTLDDAAERLTEVLGNPISTLPPGRRLAYVFDLGSRRFDTDLPTAYEFTVDCDGPAGAVETFRSTVDLTNMRHAMIETRPTKRIEDHLKKIEAHMKTIAKAAGKQAP